MTGVRVVAKIAVQAGKGAELLAHWPALAEQVRAEEGCLSYALYPHAQEPDTFVVLEQWASAQALEAHMKAPPLAEFGAVLGPIAAAAPEVTVLKDEPQ